MSVISSHEIVRAATYSRPTPPFIMSIRSVTSRHLVQVLELTQTTGVGMGTHRAYAPRAGDPLECTVVPRGSADQIWLGQEGALITHKIYFHEDPLITENHLLKWLGVGNNTVMEPVGLPQNVHGQSRMWTVEANSKTIRNQAVTIMSAEEDRAKI